MKKILVSLAALVALSSMAVAANDYKLVGNAGVTFDNVSGFDNKTGVAIGVGVERDVQVKNVSLVLSTNLNAGFYDHYQTYALDVNGKYEVMPKLNVLAGVSYNFYDVSNNNNPNGFGFQTGLEYKINNQLSANVQYKYVDLNDGIDYSNNVVTGVKYTF